jgi:hypothetical protein
MLAIGSDYRDQAVTLARSLVLHSGNVKRAIVTDTTDDRISAV